MKQPLGRTIGYWLLVFFAAWLIGAGLLAWVTVEGRMLGIPQAVRLGVPAWHLIFPAYGVLSLALLLTRRPGTYWGLAIGHFVFAFGAGLPLLGSWQMLDDRYGLDPTIWAALIFILGLLFALVAMFMALGEALLLSSPLARLIYAGRVGHLRGLFALAAQRGWQAGGPQPPDHSVFVAGQHEGRDVRVQSGEKVSYGADSGHFYWVSIAAKSVLPAMALAVGRPLARPADRERELRGKCHTAGKLMMDFYLWPQAGQDLPPAAVEAIAQALDRGRRFLRVGSAVYTDYNTIYYGQKSIFRLSDGADQMAELIDWLAGLAAVLERETTLVEPLLEAAPGLLQAPAVTDAASAATSQPASAPLGPASLAGRALLAVLLTVGFYALALAIAAALLFLIYADVRWASHVHPQLIIGCVLAAGSILWAIRPRRDRFEAPGLSLLPDEHPRLFAEMADVAKQMKQAMPREVYLVADANAAVLERGGVLGIGGKRVMILGLPVLQTLTSAQLRGVVAHEFGHFYGGDTRLSPWVYKTREAIGRTIQGLGDRSWLQAPFRWYGLLFLRITHAISRRQEFVADNLAARLVGPQTYAEGLRTIHGIAPAFDGYMRQEYIPALESGYRPPFLEGFGRFIKAPRVSQLMERTVAEEAQAQRSDPYDTHPSLGERLAALAALPGETAAADASPALALLGDVPAAEAALLAGMVRPEYRDKLQPVSWDDIGQAVYLSGWQEDVRAHAAGLASVTPATLPAFLAAPGPLAELITRRSERTLLQQQVAGIVRNLTGAALAVALARAGWTVDAAPGIPITLRRGEDAVEPFVVVHMLAEGKLSGEGWVQRCVQLGIADLSLAGA